MIIATIVLLSLMETAAGGEATDYAYQPKGLLSWDYWFAEDPVAKTYHAFYLQYPVDADQSRRHGYQWVGHATSQDLRVWKTAEDALKPVAGTFNDKGIATGSVARGDDGKWYMWFSSNGTKKNGIALAVSKDLSTWEKQPESLIEPAPLKAEWEGKTYEGRILADPYVHPEKIRGMYWLTINTAIQNPPEGMERGAVLMMKSRDLRTWEPHRFVAYPGEFERCETTQTWEHAGKWYLYFGGAGGPGGNQIYMADAFDGPYKKQPWSRIELPDGKFFYIGKRIKAFDGREYFLGVRDYTALSKPYPISYAPDGRVILGE